ncbi:MAG: hypothetical protein N3A38_10415 [Planctomycetota bacterium]|nr:hypothetical protein [Planctomycetota bacterium]
MTVSGRKCHITVVGCLFLALAAVTGERASGDQSNVVLDTGSFWRCHLTLRDPIAGSGPEANSWMPGSRVTVNCTGCTGAGCDVSGLEGDLR